MKNNRMNCSQEIKDILETHLKDIEKNVVFYEINDSTFQTLTNGERNYVFIIEDGKYVFDLLEYKPMGFIRKQFMSEDIKNIMMILNYKTDYTKDLLTFNNSGNKLSVTPDKILYLEAQSHYVIINTTTIVFKVREKISDLVQRLSPYGFRQVHRSYLINEHHLIAYTHDECILTGQVRVPLSRKYKL